MGILYLFVLSVGSLLVPYLHWTPSAGLVRVLIAAVAAVLGLASMCLVYLGFCAVLTRSRAAVQLVQQAATRAGIGAIFGSLLGVRILLADCATGAFGRANPGHGTSCVTGPSTVLGTIGNATTLVTLAFIASCLILRVLWSALFAAATGLVYLGWPAGCQIGPRAGALDPDMASIVAGLIWILFVLAGVSVGLSCGYASWQSMWHGQTEIWFWPRT